MSRITAYDREGYPRLWAIIASGAGILATPYAIMWVSVQLANLIGTI